MSYPLNDNDFEDVTITDVHAERGGGGWWLTHSGSWTYFVPNTVHPAPKAGMTARFYPRGRVNTVRGVFLDGHQVFYRSAAEQAQLERTAKGPLRT